MLLREQHHDCWRLLDIFVQEMNIKYLHIAHIHIAYPNPDVNKIFANIVKSFRHEVAGINEAVSDIVI